MSISTPLPPRHAARTAVAPAMPATHEAKSPPAASGGRSIPPRPAIELDQPWRVNSFAGRPTHGPVSPNGVTDTTIASGWASCSVEPVPSSDTMTSAGREQPVAGRPIVGGVADHHRPLARVEVGEQGAVGTGRQGDVAGDESAQGRAVGWLDPRDGRAGVDEHLGGVGPGDAGAQVDDEQVLEDGAIVVADRRARLLHRLLLPARATPPTVGGRIHQRARTDRRVRSGTTGRIGP